jgi:hypothetical protein
MDSHAAIAVSGLVKRFGDVPALDGIDFVVPAGTVFGLLGPNGAGNDSYYNQLGRIQTYGTFGYIGFERSNGTRETPTATSANAQHGGITGGGYDGTNWQTTGAIEFISRGTISSGNVPMGIVFRTSSAGTTGLTNRIEFAPNGNAGFGLVGSSAQTARVHIAAGTATASTAPLKINDGTLLTTAEDGAIEHASDVLYFTAGTSRENITRRPTSIPVYTGGSTLLVLTNHPNSEQALGNSGGTYIQFDATGFAQIRVSVRVTAASASGNNPRLYPSYSTDGGTNFTTIGAGTVASGDAISMAAVGSYTTNWITIPTAARADLVFRISQNGGDGAADPSTGIATIQFR